MFSVLLVFTSTHQRRQWGEDLSISSVSGTLEVKPQENLRSSWFQSWHSESSGLTPFCQQASYAKVCFWAGGLLHF